MLNGYDKRHKDFSGLLKLSALFPNSV